MQILMLVLENFTTICLLIGLGIIIISNQNFDKKTNMSFAILVVVIICLVIAEITERCSAAMLKPSVLRYFASALGYVLRPTAAAILVNILLRRKKTNVALWIPIIVIAIISFTSIYTHLMFWFDENNNFMRGPLSYITHIFSAIYMIILLLLIIRKHKYITSGEMFTVLFSVLICVVATVLETMYSNYRFLLTGAMAVSCALYYVVLYAETFKVDQLTGLLNRKSLYLNENKLKEKHFSVISVDVNCLKKINDSQGHRAGDNALKRLANILVAAGGTDYCPFRVGGDEFIVLGRETNAEIVEGFIDEVREKLKDEKLMASFGYAFYKPGDNFDDVCNQADEYMYDDKKQYKHRTHG